MKKIILLLIFAAIGYLPSSGQLAVTDPTHTAASILGHLQNFEEAVRSGIELSNQLAVLKKTYDNIEAVKGTFDVINQYIYNMQEIISAAENLIYITQRTAEVYRMAVRSNTFDTRELIYLMDHLASTIERANKNVVKLQSYIQKDKWKMPDRDRLAGIEAANDSTAKNRADLDKIAAKVAEQAEQRQKRDYLVKNKLLNPLEMAYINSRANVELLPGMELTYLLSNAGFEQESEFDTVTSAANKPKELFTTFQKLYFVLSGFIALIGAYRVYRKINLGDEGIGKTIATWFITALGVFILGSMVELFLK